MKFLAFVDLHQDFNDLELIRLKIEDTDPDFIICAGDFTIFGNELTGILSVLETLGKPIYIIHGNHEVESELRIACSNFKSIHFSHKKIVQIKDFTFVFYGGGGFSTKEPSFSKFINKNKGIIQSAKNLFLITHAPPYNTCLDEISSEVHVGVSDFRKFIETYKPILAISGHIHESYKKQEFIGPTLVINPGWDGEVFEI